ncbi:MAG: TetR/AcrR family transcriptional regulator [Deferribacterales bacterium]
MEAKKIKKSRKIGAPTGPRNADGKRSLLLEAASSLFIEKGYDKATMDEIASAANVAKGTLYHYFKNKAELLQAMREDFEKEAMARVIPAVSACEPDDHISKIKAWVDGAVRAYFELNEMHDVAIYGSGMPFRNTMADAEITKSLKTIIIDGADAGVWNIEDPHWTAVTMFYSFRGGCDEAILGTVTTEEVPEKLKTLFLRILGK